MCYVPPTQWARVHSTGPSPGVLPGQQNRRRLLQKHASVSQVEALRVQAVDLGGNHSKRQAALLAWPSHTQDRVSRQGGPGRRAVLTVRKRPARSRGPDGAETE